jgi:hypothetical protein
MRVIDCLWMLRVRVRLRHPQPTVPCTPTVHLHRVIRPAARLAARRPRRAATATAARKRHALEAAGSEDVARARGGLCVCVSVCVGVCESVCVRECVWGRDTAAETLLLPTCCPLLPACCPSNPGFS